MPNTRPLIKALAFKRTIAVTSCLLVSGLVLGSCGSSSNSSSRLAEAADADTCGWGGTASEVLAEANAAMGEIDLTDEVANDFGDAAVLGDARISELKFGVAGGATQPPMGSDFSNIDAIFNIPVYADGDTTKDTNQFVSVHIAMTGKCVGSYGYVPQMWLETFGVDAPGLEIQAAVNAGLDFLKQNSASDDAMEDVRLQDMLLYKRLDEGFPLTWFMRGRVDGKNFILQIEQDGSVKTA